MCEELARGFMTVAELMNLGFGSHLLQRGRFRPGLRRRSVSNDG
jgi:hypothetical protein